MSASISDLGLLGAGVVAGAMAAMAFAARERWRELGRRGASPAPERLPPLAEVDSPFFALRIQHNGTLIEASASLQTVLGLRNDQLPISIADLMVPDDESRLSAAIDEVLRRGGPRSIHSHLIGATSTNHPVLIVLHSAHGPLRQGAAETRVIEALGVDLVAYVDRAERYQQLFEAAPDAMLLVDAAGNIRMANRAAEQMLGWSQVELTRLAVENLVPTRVRDLHERVREAYKSGIVQPAAKTKGFGDAGDLIAVHRDGTKIPVEIALSPLQIGNEALVAASIRDIRERRLAAAALEESEKRLRTLANHLPGVAYRCALDAERTVFYVSDGIFALARRLAEEFIEPSGPGLSELIHPDDRDAVRTALQDQVAARNHYEVEYRINAAGEIRHVWERGVAVRTGSGSVAWLDGVILDISDRKIAEQALERARVEAIAASRAKSEFLANMSHEIRTPLNAVLGFAEILGSMVKDERQRHYLVSIEASGRSLLQLINDILDLSKVEAGKLELRPGPVHVRRLLDEVRAIFAQKSSERGVRLDVQVDDAVPTVLSLDEGRLRQVLVNLVGNAVKFTSNGAVTMRLGAAQREDGRFDLDVEVQDSGIGIPADDLQRIFDAFEQRQGHDDIRFGGSGLGLAITRRLVEMMGGRIEVKSEVGVGSTFRFLLHGLEVADGVKDGAQSVPLEAIRFAPARVLIVDDIVANRSVLRGFLEPCGLELDEAASGEQALAIAGARRPDLVLMDLRMPGMDGFDATRALRSLPGCGDLAVLAVTAAVVTWRNEESAALFGEVLHKPLTRDSVFAALQRHLRWELKEIAVASAPAGASRDVADTDWSVAVTQPGINGLITWLVAQDARVQELAATRSMDGLNMLAVDLHSEATRFGINQIHAFATQIEDAVGVFDLDGLDASLQRWPSLVQELQDEVAAVRPEGSAKESS